MHDEVSRRHLHRDLRTFPHDRVEKRLLHLEEEWIAVLVLLQVVRGIRADAAAPQLVLAHAGLLELVEDVAQRRLADASHPTRRQLEPAALAFDVARLLQKVRDLAKLVQSLASLRAEELLREGSIDVVGPEAAALELRLEAVLLLHPFPQ